MRIQVLTNLLLLLVFLGNAFNLSAQENYEIRQITFKGNKTLDKDFLLGKMALKEVSYLEKILTKKEPSLYNQELINMDLDRLTRVYQSEGFLKAKVKLLPLKINDKKQTVKLRIQITEGKPVLVDSISMRILEKMEHVDTDSLLKKVNKRLGLTNDKRFRDEALKQDIQTINAAFKSLGYAYVSTDYDLKLKIDSFRTKIYYTIFPGPKSFFGETTISGHKHVKEKFIRKQLEYKKGELYDESKLNETRNDLYRLQLFRVVSVLPQKDEEIRKSPIPVDVYLEEAPRLSTRFGAGYGTEDKFRAFLDLNLRGFLGGARRVNLYLKHSALEPYSADLRWIQPQFLGLNSSIALNPFIRRNSEPGYDIRTYGLNIPYTYHFNDWLSSKITYYLEDVEQRVTPGDQEFPDFKKDKFPYKKSGFLIGTVFDNSNPTFSPQRGVNLSVGLKLNGFIFGSTFSYSRLWGDFRTYHDIGAVIVAFRVMAGGIASNDTSRFIPVEDRFYSGGSNSIRGWKRSELGPKRNDGSPLGGKSIFETNLEMRYPLFWRLSVAAFIEAGNVWKASYTYRLNELGYAAGSGLRVETPIGPVRLDLGFPIFNQKKTPQFFISVGQAF